MFPVALLLIGLSVIVAGQKTSTMIDDAESYAIYNAIFSAEKPEKNEKPRKLIIDDQTTDYPSYGDEDRSACLKPSPGEEKTLAPLIENYRKVNEKPSLLQRKFQVPFEYELVDHGTIEGFFNEKGPGGWPDFYKRFPKSRGYVYMSAVGYNADKTLALVYVGHSCGGLCGGGGYYFMKKVDNKWTEVNWPGTTCTWVS